LFYSKGFKDITMAGINEKTKHPSVFKVNLYKEGVFKCYNEDAMVGIPRDTRALLELP